MLSIIQDANGNYLVVDTNTGIAWPDIYATLEDAQAAIAASINTNPGNWVDVGFVFMQSGGTDMRRVYLAPDGGYYLSAPRPPAIPTTPDATGATLYTGTAQSMRDWIASSYSTDRTLAAAQDKAFTANMTTVFAVVGAAVGAAALLQSGALASWMGGGDVPITSGGVAATDVPVETAVSASVSEAPTAGAGWVSSGDLPFTATEAAGGTISAPTSIMLSDAPSWMDTASTVAKATAGAVTSSGGISAGGVLSTLATIAKALTGGAKPPASRYAPGAAPFDTSAANAQSIQGMLPYLALAAIAVVALRGK